MTNRFNIFGRTNQTKASDHEGLQALGLSVGFNFCGLESLENMPLEFTSTLSLSDSKLLTSLEGLERSKLHGLRLIDCVSLRTLKGCPPRIEDTLELEGCTALESLEYLPKHIGFNLDLRFCRDFTTFPEDVYVQGWIIVSHTQNRLIEVLEKQGRAIEIVYEDQ